MPNDKQILDSFFANQFAGLKDFFIKEVYKINKKITHYSEREKSEFPSKMYSALATLPPKKFIDFYNQLVTLRQFVEKNPRVVLLINQLDSLQIDDVAAIKGLVQYLKLINKGEYSIQDGKDSLPIILFLANNDYEKSVNNILNSSYGAYIVKTMLHYPQQCHLLFNRMLADDDKSRFIANQVIQQFSKPFYYNGKSQFISAALLNVIINHFIQSDFKKNIALEEMSIKISLFYEHLNTDNIFEKYNDNQLHQYLDLYLKHIFYPFYEVFWAYNKAEQLRQYDNQLDFLKFIIDFTTKQYIHNESKGKSKHTLEKMANIILSLNKMINHHPEHAEMILSKTGLFLNKYDAKTTEKLLQIINQYDHSFQFFLNNSAQELYKLTNEIKECYSALPYLENFFTPSASCDIKHAQKYLHALNKFCIELERYRKDLLQPKASKKILWSLFNRDKLKQIANMPEYVITEEQKNDLVMQVIKKANEEGYKKAIELMDTLENDPFVFEQMVVSKPTI